MTIKDVIYPVGTPSLWKVTVQLNEKKCAQPFLTVAIRNCIYCELPEWAIKAKVIKINEINLQKQELDVTLETA